MLALQCVLCQRYPQSKNNWQNLKWPVGFYWHRENDTENRQIAYEAHLGYRILKILEQALLISIHLSISPMFSQKPRISPTSPAVFSIETLKSQPNLGAICKTYFVPVPW